MLAKSVVWILTLKFVQSQLNGDFWWLNKQLNGHYKNARPPPPKFEVLSEFDNDESAKIVFPDDHLLTNSNKKSAANYIANKNNQKTEVTSLDKDRIVWPDEVNKVVYNNFAIFNNIIEDTLKTTTENIAAHDMKDEIVFDIHKNENFILNNVVNVSTITENYTNLTKNDSLESAILFNDDRLSISVHKGDESQSQNICTYMKKNKCYGSSGLVYSNPFRKNFKKDTTDTHKICCILPLPVPKDTTESSKIFFTDTLKNYKRIKRSGLNLKKKDQDKNDTINLAFKQRNALLQRIFSNKFQKLKSTSTIQTKVNTPDDEYADPYWNIKNSNFRNPDNQNNKQSNTKHSCDSEEYIDDYVVEVPKPGLVGIYTDHGKEPSGWSFLNENKGPFYSNDDNDGDNYEEDSATSFGYSTIDPRQEAKSNRNRKPVKLKENSDEETYDAESQTINFQSSPDFQVLQGFKLLNLIRNKSRIQSKHGKKTSTTESIFNHERKESHVTRPTESSETPGNKFSDENQLFNGCGNIVDANEEEEWGLLMGDARNSSHPWLALLVLTKRPQTVLCYATLVHSRAAITAADCVDGISAGEITLIAGLWNLNERSRSRNRVVSVHVHPRYRPGDIPNNLAILWMRPLRLGLNVHPACLAEPHIGDDCKFYGWGGYGAFHPKSRWQRASIRACSTRVMHKHGMKSANEAFCTSVQSRSVTGIGGSLICHVDGRHSAVGIIISRDNAYILLRAREWTLRTIEKLTAA